MKLTRERKVYAAVLGLGLAVLGVDRLFLGGTSSPRQAAASAPVAGAQAAAPVTAPDAAPASDGEQTGGARLLASRLEGMRAANRSPVIGSPFSANSPLRSSTPLHGYGLGPGLFTTKGDWLGATTGEVAALTLKPKPAEPLKEKLARHQITAVALAGRASAVMIDGRPYPLGEMFEGVKIVQIERGAVTFESRDERVRIDLEKEIAGR
jgi:hypothetical protein